MDSTQVCDQKQCVFACKSSLEIIHGRWAMLGMPGVFIPELLVRYGGVHLSEPVWWKVGSAKLQVTVLEEATDTTFKPLHPHPYSYLYCAVNWYPTPWPPHVLACLAA